MRKIKLKKLLASMPEDEFIRRYNMFCMNNYYKDVIYNNGERFLQTYFDSMLDLSDAVRFGDYVSGDKYVRFDEDGTLISFDEINFRNLKHLKEFLNYELRSINK
ncbi:MAG TPA: hypothetical protein PKX15_04520 [Bacteroidales bacterium]|jgi:hypothetical protein|nr:hypothetical protein [Bacteroidales bacterium]HPD25104.1 hypothetical protein [Bacteroidales bacterium]